MTRIIVFSKKSLLNITLALLIAVLVISILQGNMFNRARESINVLVANAKLKPIYFVDTEEKKIAISFDATWGAEHTPKILETLEEHNIKTTFFLTNIWLEEYPEVAKAITAQGHELAMHSVSHPHMNTLSEPQILEELQENAKLIKETTDFDAKLFRPPFGEYNNKVIKVINDAGFIPIQWSIDSLDWKENMTKQDIIDRVTKKIHPGAIVLFHNNATYTPDALEEIIKYAFNQGYQIIPISHLLYKDNYYVDHQGAQKPKKRAQ